MTTFILLMPYKSMMRALSGTSPLAYESRRITVPHTHLQPRTHCMGPLGAGQIQVAAAALGEKLDCRDNNHSQPTKARP